MRRGFLVIIAFAILLSGCSMIQAEEPIVASEDLTTPKPKEYVITHRANENWEKDQASDFLQYDLVQTEEDAIAVANAILEATVGEESFQTYYLANVWSDTEREVWVTTFFLRSEVIGFEMHGGDITIVIRKHDAQVVKMWGGE